jgi:hypothetical protein
MMILPKILKSHVKNTDMTFLKNKCQGPTKAKNKRKVSAKEEFRPLKDLKISKYALRTLIPPWNSIYVALF